MTSTVKCTDTEREGFYPFVTITYLNWEADYLDGTSVQELIRFCCGKLQLN